MVLVFLACGIVSFKQLGTSGWEELNALWTESIAFARGGQEGGTMGFWSVFLFAWFCNAAMHIGMSDLSVYRFAKKASYGWASAAGMYIGHYMAWIAAAFMLAAQIKLQQDSNPVPGPMASSAAGLAGIICVVVAGWTTANPTIYRAGLAFQAIIPRGVSIQSYPQWPDSSPRLPASSPLSLGNCSDSLGSTERSYARSGPSSFSIGTFAAREMRIHYIKPNSTCPSFSPGSCP